MRSWIRVGGRSVCGKCHKKELRQVGLMFTIGRGLALATLFIFPFVILGLFFGNLFFGIENWHFYLAISTAAPWALAAFILALGEMIPGVACYQCSACKTTESRVRRWSFVEWAVASVVFLFVTVFAGSVLILWLQSQYI